MTQNSKNLNKSTTTTRISNEPVKSQILSEDVVVEVAEPEVVAEEVVETPLTQTIREKLAELDERGVSVVYPTSEGRWNQALLDRLLKM